MVGLADQHWGDSSPPVCGVVRNRLLGLAETSPVTNLLYRNTINCQSSTATTPPD